MIDADSLIKTYIIKTSNNEYYCGKTNNISRRMNEHRNTHSSWFCNSKRRNFKDEDIKIFNGDFEKQIKRCGVKLVYVLMESAS